MASQFRTAPGKLHSRFLHVARKHVPSLSVAAASLPLGLPGNAAADGLCPVVFDTTPYWSAVQAIIGGWGPGQSSTLGETFIAPTGAGVTLNDFSFYAQSYYPYNGGIASIYLQAFVYEWSGSLTGHGGRAVGNPVYLGPSFVFSPPAGPNGWVPLTASFGAGGLALTPGGHYVMGFTLSNPANYAASNGAIEFQEVPNRNPNEPQLPPGVDGFGGAVWDNNGNNFAALNSAVWDTWGDTGDFAFTAHLTVVPEPSTLGILAAVAVGFIGRRGVRRR